MKVGRRRKSRLGSLKILLPWYTDELGFCSVEVFPSPKSHAHDVIGPVELSVKVTFKGYMPDDGLKLKSAVNGAEMLIHCVTDGSDERYGLILMLS